MISDIIKGKLYQKKIIVEYEGEIHVSTKKYIVSLFPEFVYVEFHPNTLFSVGTPVGIVIEASVNLPSIVCAFTLKGNIAAAVTPDATIILKAFFLIPFKIPV